MEIDQGKSTIDVLVVAIEIVRDDGTCDLSCMLLTFEFLRVCDEEAFQG